MCPFKPPRVPFESRGRLVKNEYILNLNIECEVSLTFNVNIIHPWARSLLDFSLPSPFFFLFFFFFNNVLKRNTAEFQM